MSPFRSRPRRTLSCARDGASSQVIGLLAGGLIYIVLFAVVIDYSSDADPQRFDNRHLEDRAESAIAILVGESGLPPDWEAAPDTLRRFGLREEAPVDNRVVLDDAKLRALRSGVMDATANGAPDYAEVHDALGLAPEQDFHLRVFPIITSFDDALFEPDPTLQVAYIGHVEATGTAGGAAGAVDDHGTYTEFHVRVWNNGSAAQPFRVTFYLDDASGTQVVDEQDTPTIALSGSTTITHRVYGYDTWNLGATMWYRVQDARGREVAEGSIAFTPPTDAGNALNVIVEPASSYFLTSDPSVAIYLDHYDASGDRLSSGASVDVTIKDKSTGTLVWSAAGVALPKNKEVVVTCELADCLDAGTYTVTVQRAGGGYAVSEDYDVLLADPPETYTESGTSEFESGIINDLYGNFDNHTDLAAGGDKVPDIQTEVAALVAELDRYDLLFVGGNVAHASMTPAEIKYGIRDWVYAGGTLVVLGSVEQNVQWLQPFAGTGLDAASGGIGAPDPTHPSLTAPNELRYEAYEDPGKAWHLRKNRENEYTHVLVRDATSEGSHDLLAVSRPGMYGDGTVVLTSYVPESLMPGDAQAVREEAARFLHNLGSQALNRASADFGPPVPDGVSVASAERASIALHPKTDGAYVQLRAIIYVWG